MIPEELSGPKKCSHCEQYHQGVCPRVKSIEYFPDGAVKRVEYHDERPSHACEDWRLQVYGPTHHNESEDL